MSDLGFAQALRAVLQGEAATAAAVAGTTGAAAALVLDALSATGRLTLVEPDGTLLDRAVAGIAPARRGAVRAVHGALGDLRTDPAAANAILAALTPRDADSYAAARRAIEAAGASSPLIPPDSLDLLVLDLTVNRAHADEAAAVLTESFRVLRKGGRLLLTVLLADEPVSCAPPVALGEVTVNAVPLETDLVAALDRAGFHGMGYVWSGDAIAVPPGAAEARPFLIAAFKGKQGPCLEQGHAVIYRGPFRETWDDDGHRYVRGERTAVCAKTYDLLMTAPYAGLFIGLPSRAAPPIGEAPPYDCATPRRRDPRVTKGLVKPGDSGAEPACAPGAGCC
ncbi:hypothetical protein FBZ83_101760 [Azospirillum brasilense]|uniref:Methyltransferase domain-containing protein n=1 Tax=Azospirillum brasilense TaxID=192 RepID=A0A560CSR3_AZOBR|nr:hypothetical protein [Azospirillum brasilense]TWA87891.1 hypothetical protein FBZ83_101760 [Azospirillum brasilense]